MRPTNDDIPLLTDVVTSGRDAGSGQSTAREQADPHTADVGNDHGHHKFYGGDEPIEEIDVGVEVIVDNVLEKHILRMRAELIAEVTALLHPSSRNRR